MFNTEFVPGENLSGKNYKWDQKDGFYVSPKHNMYSSYFYNPEDDSLSMIDKFKLHGNEYVKHLDGGSALHMNVAEHLYQGPVPPAAQDGRSLRHQLLHIQLPQHRLQRLRVHQQGHP